MGKKKRKKQRVKPLDMPGLTPEIQRAMDERRKMSDQAFLASCAQVRAVITRFHPGDVVTALNISDLWLPNRASQVKHLLAFSLLVATPAECFLPARMNTYDVFAEFCTSLFDALPALGMLEDYVPDADWGAVKILLGDLPVGILHGGPVQRIVDYVEAFRICYGHDPQAELDLECAARIQSELLRQVPGNGGEDVGEEDPGHIEVPPVFFWNAMLSALTQLPAVEDARDQYIVELGHPSAWSNESEFADAVMTGTVLPWLAIRVDGVLRSIGLRNTMTVVVEAWAKTRQVFSAHLATRLGGYLEKRIDHRTCKSGPLFLESRHERVPVAIAAILRDDDRFFVVVPVTSGQLETAGKTVTAMRRVMRAVDWGFRVEGSRHGFQILDADGVLPKPADIEIVLVKAQFSNKFSVLKLPGEGTRVMTLLDACTIFDSVESVGELVKFWSYVDGLKQFRGPMFGDLGDLFGSFRDAHAQLVEGAVNPHFLGLDPHWGASWRYRNLQQHWAQAPLNFPDEGSVWQTHIRERESSLTRVVAKNAPKQAWSSVLSNTTVHFVLDVDAVGLAPEDGSLLELFTQIAADSLAERASIIAPFLNLPFRRVTLDCFSAPHLLASVPEEQIQQAIAMPLVTSRRGGSQSDADNYRAGLTVNLARLVQGLENTEDAGFEVACALAILEQLFSVLGSTIPPELRQAMEQTSSRQRRFTLNRLERSVDVPDYTSPEVPKPEDYKVARRNLAILLKDQGVSPGEYLLEAAKALINPARAAFRDAVHQRIGVLDRESLLQYCVEQHDALIAEDNRKELRVKQSLRHEVDYDREQHLAEGRRNFVNESKNYRYLLESALVLTSPQNSPVRAEAVLSILAMIDWLYVLYDASDVLHNGIDVGGLRVSDQYVPEVFYSVGRKHQEEVFGREMAALRLGTNVMEEDKVTTALSMEDYTAVLDNAFVKDLKFSYSHLLQVLSILILWVSADGAEELACGYVSDRRTIAERAVEAYPSLPLERALDVVEFLLLAPEDAWRLIGKDVVESDVPVWEHSKRGSRHTIRPLISLSGGRVLWGAAAVDRAKRIWTNSISAGYLPADYPWPAVRDVVGRLKKELEDRLEDRAYEIVTRDMAYVAKGIDFKYRFPKQQFPDVGDFDVLAYRPEENQWLTVECKYNQPAFCLKDARRLRDRIFGRGNDRGQLEKIERRRVFLTNNVDALRSLLGWPEPSHKPLTVTELYVSRDTHFWLRFPPYEVPTHFVQIDMLDSWLKSASS